LRPSNSSGNQFQNKDLMQGNQFHNEFQSRDLSNEKQFLNKDMANYESNQFQSKDLMQGNEFHNKDMLQNNQFQNNQFQNNQFQNNQFQNNDFQQGNFNRFEGDRLASLGATDNVMNKDNILAKNDLNAEIKGLGQAHIMPSEISHKHGEFQHEKLQSDLTGFSGSHDLNNNSLAKKEVLAEIQQAGVGHKDNILPSEMLGGSQFHAKDQSLSKDFKSQDFNKDLQGNQFQNFQSKPEEFENTAEFQNKQFEQHNTYISDKSGELGAMFKDEVMREHIQLKKELNAEIKEVAAEHPNHLLPSEILGANPAGGVTVIHDGRDKGESNYELAKESIEASEQPMSLTQRLAATVANAAVAVKDAVMSKTH